MSTSPLALRMNRLGIIAQTVGEQQRHHGALTRCTTATVSDDSRLVVTDADAAGLTDSQAFALHTVTTKAD
jgi:hypothetical protein